MRRFVGLLTALSGLLAAGVIGERLLTGERFGPSALVLSAILLLGFAAFLATFLLWNSRHRETLAKIWMAAISVGVSYLVLDFVAGLVLIHPLSPPLVPDEYRHHKLVPNSYSRLQQRDFDYIQRINNLGMRGEDVPVAKPPHEYRVLTLGDSFTMGKGVADEQTFAVLLEKSLNADPPVCSGGTVKVLNGGVDSYAPILSLIQLERDLHVLQPDMVILNFDVSDLIQETAYRREAVRGSDGEIVAVPPGPPRESITERFREWAERRLFFTRALLYYTNQLFGYRTLTVRDVTTQANFEVVAHTLKQDTESRDEQWANVFDSFDKIRRFCAERNIKFVLSLYPWAHQISDTEWTPGRVAFMPEGSVASEASANRIRSYAAEHGVPMADAYPDFRAALGAEALFFSHDMHWTPAGNKVMARALDRNLKDLFGKQWCQ